MGEVAIAEGEGGDGEGEADGGEVGEALRHALIEGDEAAEGGEREGEPGDAGGDDGEGVAEGDGDGEEGGEAEPGGDGGGVRTLGGVEVERSTLMWMGATIQARYLGGGECRGEGPGAPEPERAPTRCLRVREAASRRRAMAARVSQRLRVGAPGVWVARR